MKYLCVLIILILFGCASTPPLAVLTEDKAGHALTMTAIPESGSRKDVPAGTKARNVVTQASFAHAGSTARLSIVRTGFLGLGEPMLYTNCLECHKTQPIPFTQPKDPWWKWPLMGGIALGMGLVAFFLRQIKDFVFFWRR